MESGEFAIHEQKNEIQLTRVQWDLRHLFSHLTAFPVYSFDCDSSVANLQGVSPPRGFEKRPFRLRRWSLHRRARQWKRSSCGPGWKRERHLFFWTHSATQLWVSKGLGGSWGELVGILKRFKPAVLTCSCIACEIREPWGRLDHLP